MQRLAELMARRRWLIAMGVTVVTAVALAGVAILGFDDVPRHFFITDGDEFAFLQEVYKDFGSDDNDCVVVLEADDLFTPQAITTLRRIVERAQAIEGVQSVQSLADAVLFEPGELPRSLLPPPDAPESAYDRARSDALAHPLLAGQLIARDARTTLIIIRLADDRIAVSDMAPVIGRIRATVQEVMAGSSLTARITGLPTIRVELFELIPREQVKFMRIGAVICFTMAFLLFRRVAAVVVISIAAMTGALWSLGALGLVGEKISLLSSILPTLVLVVGFTDGVHLMYDIRASRRAGLTRLDASCSAVRHLGPACGLTSLTTAIGFGSLSIASVPLIRRFGLACGAGVALALAAVLLIVSLLSSTRLGDHVGRKTPSKLGARLAPYCYAWIHAVIRHARWVSVIGVAVTLVLVLTALRLRPDATLTESIPASSESAQALWHCDDAFGGVLFSFIQVAWPEDRTLASRDVLSSIAAAQQLFVNAPSTRNSLSVLDLLKVLPGEGDDLADRVPLLQFVPEGLRNRFVREDRRRALVMAHVANTGTAAAEPVLAELDRQLSDLQRRYPGITMRQTGTTVIAVHQINRMIRDLATSLGLAGIAIFGVMTIALRSVRLGLLTVLPNAFPLSVTAAFLVWSGRHLELTSVIVFSICLGVAVDDTIHFVMRFRRELAVDGSVPEALSRTFVSVGAALLTTTAVLIGGFGSVLVSDMPSMRLFSMLACIALLAALIGDLILLPALLACFGGSVPAFPVTRRPE